MSIHTVSLGQDGPEVQAVGVGLMSIGHAYGNAGDTPSRLKYLDALYEMGATNWDTANIYGDCEEVVGEWFKANPEKRKDIFLATKFGFLSQTNLQVRSDPEFAKEEFAKSLEKLKTDYIDLYYCHRVDGKTPIEKTVKAMAELKEQGKIRNIGLSEVSAKTLRRAHAIHPISALQVEYSPFSLEIESNDVLATCKELGITVVAYSPLGRGFLTGSIKSPDDIPADDWRKMMPRFQGENFWKNLELVKKIEQLAKDKGVQSSQLVLAWLTKQGVIPIPGTRSSERVKENIASLSVELTDEEVKMIREASESAGNNGARYPEFMEALQLGETPEL